MVFLGLIGVILAIGFDSILGFIAWTLYKYFDLKYFSTFEISQLKEENKYLKEENKKVNGNNSMFWSSDND